MTIPKIRDAQFVAASSEIDGLPAPTFVELAFAGRSNVGKSSLLNVLVQRKKLARTSGRPGATRTINVFRVELVEPEVTLDFVDLPGYGYAKRSKQERRAWGVLMERFLQERAGLRSVVVLVDSRRGFEDEDLDFIAYLRQLDKEVLAVATKLDQVKPSERKLRIAALSKSAGTRVLGVSSQTSDGLDALWAKILAALVRGEA